MASNGAARHTQRTLGSTAVQPSGGTRSGGTRSGARKSGERACGEGTGLAAGFRPYSFMRSRGRASALGAGTTWSAGITGFNGSFSRLQPKGTSKPQLRLWETLGRHFGVAWDELIKYKGDMRQFRGATLQFLSHSEKSWGDVPTAEGASASSVTSLQPPKKQSALEDNDDDDEASSRDAKRMKDPRQGLVDCIQALVPAFVARGKKPEPKADPKVGLSSANELFCQWLDERKAMQFVKMGPKSRIQVIQFASKKAKDDDNWASYRLDPLELDVEKEIREMEEREAREEYEEMLEADRQADMEALAREEAYEGRHAREKAHVEPRSRSAREGSLLMRFRSATQGREHVRGMQSRDFVPAYRVRRRRPASAPEMYWESEGEGAVIISPPVTTDSEDYFERMAT
ncbi:hypothetical protein B0T24DRAFT_598407 [Lasiosphaeria ovina]|uniref:Uncharacterized protein n=1 Tax=Lasiosphaeria ovina TaxID=92902 RepID=A0AAE0JVG8_9PEZI|nr:hypothetical protein B0T24DRAFT_598407 [Lasiosphaeria ovina]